MDDTDTMERPDTDEAEVDSGQVVDLFALDEDTPRVYEEPIPLDPKIFEPRTLSIKVQRMGVPEWVELGNELFLIEDRSPFWLGDWYNEGRKKWGEEVNAFFDAENAPKVKTASNHGIVCDKIPPEDRHPDCNMSVTRAAAGLPSIANIRKALRLAAEGKDGVVDGVVVVDAAGEPWSEKQMRQYVKAFKGKDADGEDLKERGEATSISFGVIWNVALADEDNAKAALEQLMGVAEEIFAENDVMPRGVSGPSITYNNS